jgi:DNA-binding transcriptional ArsR family regulator
MPANKPTPKPKHSGPIRFAVLAMGSRAAAEPKRAHVLLALGEGPRHLGALHAEVGGNLSLLSRQLTLMRLAGLVDLRQDGRRHVFSLAQAGREMLRVIEAPGGWDGRTLLYPPTKPKRPAVDCTALAGLFRRLSDPTHAHILLFLGDGERHVGALSLMAGCSQSTISSRLVVLRSTGLVEARHDGLRRVYSLTGAGRAMASAVATLGGRGGRRAKRPGSQATPRGGHSGAPGALLAGVRARVRARC